MNRVLGQKVGIVSKKPQTTRRQVRGILNLPRAQVVLVDTPGLHGRSGPVDVSLERQAREAVEGADAVLVVTDRQGGNSATEEKVFGIVRGSGKPSFLVLNKCDLLSPGDIRTHIDRCRRLLIFRKVMAVSAKTGRNVSEAMEEIVALLPEGPPLFPVDIISDQPERDFFGEILREKIFRHVHQELPYSSAVVIDQVEEDRRKGLYRVGATIFVERESQKGMLIGGGGQGLKRIGQAARLDMEALTGEKVYLSLWVKVRKNWTRDPRSLREFGFE
jgi:GTP-binding protein Era